MTAAAAILDAPAGEPRLDARAKLGLCLGLVLITVSVPATDLRILAGLAAIVLGLVVALRVPPGLLARRLLAIAPFILVAAAGPALHGGSLAHAGGTLAKAGLGCAALVVLAASTPVDELLAALAALRCPRLIVLLLGLTVRYLHVLTEEASRLRRAAAARGFAPRHLLQARIVGALIGALFLRSLGRAERVHFAMQARGFAGELVTAPPAPLRACDLAIPAAVLGLALAWRLLG